MGLALTPSPEGAVVDDEADRHRHGHHGLHQRRRRASAHEQAQLQRGVEDEERDPRADENSMGGDQPQLSTTLMASRVTLTSRSISAAVTTSGGAK